jgi:exopolysaccharide biosynthesis WecB/TagA/CpsF family protein
MMAMQTSELPQWRTIFDVPVAALGYQEAARLVVDILAAKSFLRVNFLNANNANISANSPKLTAALQQSVVLSDGVGLDVASRMLYGAPFPANLNGTDFVPRLLKDLPQSLTIGLVGSELDVVTEAALRFAEIAPQHNFIVISDGYFTAETQEKVMRNIHAAKPDILLVGMGTPQQEVWTSEFIGPDECTIVFTVGALFDFISRRVARAPIAFRTLKLEWLFRLALEPRRLFRRYVLGNPAFILRAFKQKLLGKAVKQNDVARTDIA